MAQGGDDHWVSVSELLDQIEVNKKHFERSKYLRSCKSTPELAAAKRGTVTSATSATGTAFPERGFTVPNGVPVDLPPVRELDVDPDTFLLWCLPFPVIRLRAVRRNIKAWFRNVFCPRAPLPCVTTTCGPISHIKECEFHPLRGGLPYNKPMKRYLSFTSNRPIQRSASLPI